MSKQKLLAFRILVSSVSMVVRSKSSFHKGAQHWLNDFSQCNLNDLIKLATMHGVMSWLAQYTKTLSSSELPLTDTIKANFEIISNQSKVYAFNSAYQQTIAKEIAEHFQQHQVNHLYFKGVAVLEQFYSAFISSRQADDLDIMVDAKDLLITVKTLQELGYTPREDIDLNKAAKFISRHHSIYRWRDISLETQNKPKHKIDLHWHIADKFSLTTSTKALLESSVKSKNSSYRSLPFEQHFIYLCVHGHTDYFFRLRSLVDLYAAMQDKKYHYPSLLQSANSMGVKKQFIESIELVTLLFVDANQAVSSDFTHEALSRFTENSGCTKRAHPNKGEWSRRDKRDHLCRQIKQRSSQSFWFAPIIARAKLGLNDINDWQGEKSSTYYLIKCWIKRLFN